MARSSYYYWRGVIPGTETRDQTHPKVHTKYRARLKLLEMGLGELEFLTQTQATEKDLRKWEEFIKDVLELKAIFQIQDPHGMTWSMFEEDSNNENAMIVTE